jgi:hypothetical protein
MRLRGRENRRWKINIEMLLATEQASKSWQIPTRAICKLNSGREIAVYNRERFRRLKNSEFASRFGTTPG